MKFDIKHTMSVQAETAAAAVFLWKIQEGNENVTDTQETAGVPILTQINTIIQK